MSSETLKVTLWRRPDGSSFVGDQYGREIEGVSSFAIDKQLETVHNQVLGTATRVTLELSVADVRELALEDKEVTPVPSADIHFPSGEGKVMQLQKGTSKVVVMTVGENCSPEIMEEARAHVKKRMRVALGEDTEVFVVQKGVEFNFYELSPKQRDEQPEQLKRPEADWAF